MTPPPRWTSLRPGVPSARVILIASWGALGVVALLVQAVSRLTPLALEPWQDGSMSGWQMALYVGWVGLNAYLEGYRGFQKRFCPRVVGRALWLGSHPRPLHVLLAPLFSMALFHASRRQLAGSWGLVLGIAAIVVAVRLLPQPWRGIVDGGVVVGLGWGIVALLVQYGRALATGRWPDAQGLPGAAAGPDMAAGPGG